VIIPVPHVIVEKSNTYKLLQAKLIVLNKSETVNDHTIPTVEEVVKIAI